MSFHDAEEKKHKVTELKTGLDEAESLVCPRSHTERDGIYWSTNYAYFVYLLRSLLSLAGLCLR